MAVVPIAMAGPAQTEELMLCLAGEFAVRRGGKAVASASVGSRKSPYPC